MAEAHVEQNLQDAYTRLLMLEQRWEQVYVVAGQSREEVAAVKQQLLVAARDAGVELAPLPPPVAPVTAVSTDAAPVTPAPTPAGSSAARASHSAAASPAPSHGRGSRSSGSDKDKEGSAP